MTLLSLRRAALRVATLLAVGIFAGCGGAATTGSPAPASPSPIQSADPSAAPSASISGEGTRFEVPLTIATSHTVTATVIDWTGLVTGATSGTPGDGASVASGAVLLANDGPTTLVVTWAAGPCDSTPTLVVDAGGSTITVVQEPCTGDAIAFDRIVRLSTSQAIDATSITGVLQPGGYTPG